MTADGQPETLDEVCDYIVRYADSIFVREQIDGTWQCLSLAQLPGKLALKRGLRFIKEGMIPVRVLSDEEVAARAKGVAH